MQFRIPYLLPIAQKRISYAEITNATHFSVLKYIATEDVILIEQMFDDLIAETTGELPSKMFVLDKFCLLLEMRSIALGDRVELQTRSARAAITISNIINNITKFASNINFQQSFAVEDVIINTHMPRKFISNSIDELINHCIYTIKHGNDLYDFDAMNIQEQLNLVDSLPAEAMNKIIEHIHNNKRIASSTNVIQSNNAIGLDAFPLDIYDGSLLSFIRSMYRDDLMNFYEMHYNIIKKLELSNDHFMSMTPNESRIFVNLHNKDMKKQQEEQERQQSTSRFSKQNP